MKIDYEELRALKFIDKVNKTYFNYNYDHECKLIREWSDKQFHCNIEAFIEIITGEPDFWDSLYRRFGSPMHNNAKPIGWIRSNINPGKSYIEDVKYKANGGFIPDIISDIVINFDLSLEERAERIEYYYALLLEAEVVA